MADVPSWAMSLTKEVALYKGRSKTPKINWWQTKNSFSSGHYSPYRKVSKRRIHISAGTNETDAKGVLLHELAHWLTHGHHHDKRFWLTLKELLIQFNSYTEEYRKREFGYMKKAQAYL